MAATEPTVDTVPLGLLIEVSAPACTADDLTPCPFLVLYVDEAGTVTGLDD